MIHISIKKLIIIISCFVSRLKEILRKFSPNFNFVFYEILAKLEEKFRENTQTKTFAATLIIFDQLDKEQVF